MSAAITPSKASSRVKIGRTARPEISVVVPTYKRPDLLGRCLSALLNQDIAPSRMESVIADDAAEE